MDSAQAHIEPGAGGSGRVLFFDGDCPLCERWSQWLLQQAPEGASRMAWQRSAPALAQRLEGAGISKQLLVSLPPDERLLGGIDAIGAFLQGGSGHLGAQVLRARWLRAPLRWLYPLVAHNRRVLAPPLSCSASGCTPPAHVGKEAAFVLLLALFTLLLAPAIGAATFPVWGLGSSGVGASWSLGLWCLVLAGQLLSSVAAPGGLRSLALRQGALATAACIAPSLLLLLAGWLPTFVGVVLCTLTLGWGIRLLLLRHVRAHLRLGLGTRWIWVALLSLWGALSIGVAMAPTA